MLVVNLSEHKREVEFREDFFFLLNLGFCIICVPYNKLQSFQSIKKKIIFSLLFI